MEDRHFDQIGTWLALPKHRRATVRGITASVLALTLGRIAGQGVAEGKNKPKKKSIGARCKKANECQSGLQCQITPSENPLQDDNVKRCCKPVDTSCTDDFDCCGMLVCNNNICTID